MCKNFLLLILASVITQVSPAQALKEDQVQALTILDETFKKVQSPKPSSKKDPWFRYRKLSLENGILKIMYTMDKPKNEKVEGYYQVHLDLSDTYYSSNELNMLRSNKKCGIKSLSYNIDKSEDFEALAFNDISKYTEDCSDFYLPLLFLDKFSPVFKNGNYEKVLVGNLKKLMLDFGGGKKIEVLKSIPKLDNLNGISGLHFGTVKDDYTSIIIKNGIDKKGQEYSVIDHTSNSQYQKIFGSDVQEIRLIYSPSTKKVTSIMISFRNNETEGNVHKSLVKNLGNPTGNSRDLDNFRNVYTWKGQKRKMILTESTIGMSSDSFPNFILTLYENSLE